MIGQEDYRHLLYQSDSKLKTIATRLFAFSRASNSLLALTLSTYWLATDSLNLNSDRSLALCWFWFFSTLNLKLLNYDIHVIKLSN